MIFLSIWILSLSCDIMMGQERDDKLNIKTIGWVDSETIVSDALHLRDSVIRTKHNRCLLYMFSKERKTDKQLCEFINNHIKQYGNSYRFIFNNPEEIINCRNFVHGGTIVYDNYDWLITLSDLLFGMVHYQTYVFKRINDGRYIFIGLAAGEPITSEGNTLKYSMKDTTFTIATNEGDVLFSKHISLDFNPQICN